MILFVKKGKGMGCGCLAQLLFLAVLGFLIGSCQQFVTAVRYKEQLSISGAEFIANRPAEKWVKISGVGVDLSGLVKIPLRREILIPVAIDGIQGGKTQILLCVDEPEDVARLEEFSKITGISAEALDLLAELLGKLNGDRQIQGIVRHGMDSFGTDEEKIAKAMPGLSEDFVIIDHGKKPGFAGAGRYFAIAVVLFLLSAASGFVGDKLNGPKAVPPPLPKLPPPLPVSPPIAPVGTLPMRLGEGCPGVFEGPKNQLELDIVAGRNREIPADEFLRRFLDSVAFVGVAADQFAEGNEMKLVNNPAVFSIRYPEHTSVCFYSHESRLKPTHDLYPEFSFAAELKVRDFLAALRSPCGITINPYWDINMEWKPEQVARMLSEY